MCGVVIWLGPPPPPPVPPMPEPPVFTLADWGRITHAATIDRVVERMTEPNLLLDALIAAHPPRPMTRCDLVIACCRMWRERLVGAWGVLRGRAVADWD